MQKLLAQGGLMGIMFFLPWAAHAAVLSLIPDRTDVMVRQTVRVAIVLDTEGDEVNAVEVNIPVPDGTDVKTVENGNSVISLWVQKPEVKCQVSGVRCQVSLMGGMPGGFRGQGTLATLVLDVQNAASTELQIAPDAQVLLNDGKGTPAKVGFEGTRLVATTGKGLEVTSATHPIETAWYAQRTVEFSWKKQRDAEYAVLLDDGPLTVPDVVSDTSKLPLRIDKVPDGVHYFHLREKQNGVWGDTTHFRIQIDGTAPDGFTINREGDDLEWNALDKGSGVQRYVGIFAPRPFQSWFATSVKSPEHISKIASWFGGTYRIRAIDAAGNVAEARYQLTGSAGAPIVITIVLIGVLLALGILIWKFRQKSLRA